MTFEAFIQRFQKAPVREYPRQTPSVAPIATVRVLVYNHARFLSRCLDSILAQQCRYPFEILVCEDESNDGSREICIDYAERHSGFIRLLLNDRRNNMRVDGAPTGLFNSIYSNFQIRSKYTALCEADDYWTDEKSLEKRIEFMEAHPDFSMCFHDGIHFRWDDGTQVEAGLFLDDDGNPITTRFVMDHGPSPPTPTILYRREWVEPAHPALLHTLCGDMVLVQKLQQHGPIAFLGDISPAMQGLHVDSMFWSKTKEDQMEMMLDSRRNLMRYFHIKGRNRTVVKQEYLKHAYWHARFVWAARPRHSWRRRWSSVRMLFAAIITSPRQVLPFIHERLHHRTLRLQIRPLDKSGKILDHPIRYYD